MEKHKTTVPVRFVYFDKRRNCDVRYTHKPDEMVVTISHRRIVESGVDTESAIRDAAQANSMKGLLHADFSRGIVVVRIASAADSLEVARSEPRAEFLNSVPAFVDLDGSTHYLIADEVSVHFNDNISDSQAAEIIDQQGSSVLFVLDSPGSFAICVPEGSDLFESINHFNELSAVKFAAPREISFGDQGSVTT